RLQLLRGASITNAPFMRSPLIGTSRYLGRLEPGWSVEAYQSGQLIAFDTTDAGGRFGFDLPVRYGENPVDFVAYGPLGDMRHLGVLSAAAGVRILLSRGRSLAAADRRDGNDGSRPDRCGGTGRRSAVPAVRADRASVRRRRWYDHDAPLRRGEHLPVAAGALGPVALLDVLPEHARSAGRRRAREGDADVVLRLTAALVG